MDLSITTKNKCANLIFEHCNIYSIYNFVIKYVSDFRQIHGFLPDSNNNAHRHYKSVILLKMALSTTFPNHNILIYVYKLPIYVNYIVLYRLSR